MKLFVMIQAVFGAVVLALFLVWPPAIWGLGFLLPLWALAVHDMLQTRHSLQRNFPVFARMRWMMEVLRPGVHLYFIESNKDGRPFDRERRSLVYQRAKGERDTLAFGTEFRVYESGYEWINHAMLPATLVHDAPRVTIGNGRCKHPYSASLLNVSAMSYGSLSKNAVLALNKGACAGGFYHNTGEGGISPYHLEGGGDLVWQLGTAYFGARDEEGRFSPEKFRERASLPNVKMIEIKLSQGAKPGHGGILPASKLTPEIIAIRGVVPGKDVISPPGHSAFDSPLGLIDFVQQLRQLSDGKPIGFKLCVGRSEDFIAIAKAMVERDIYPDFITVDGAEGGTGAAPMEFSNSVGMPLKEGLTLVHNVLMGLGIREHIRIIAAGKSVSAFDLARTLALGADLVNSARAMMFALGCIQAQACNSNTCPTGVATQDPKLTKGLVVANKAPRVANYQKETIRTLLEVVAAAGLTHPNQLRPKHIMRRISPAQVASFATLYPAIPKGALARGEVPEFLQEAWQAARMDSFA
jgi:glutamate synthase domain-containing protein 2